MINHDHPVALPTLSYYFTPQRFNTCIGLGLGRVLGEIDLPEVHHCERVFDGVYLVS